MPENPSRNSSVFLMLDYHALRACVVQTLKHAGNTRADVLLLAHHGETAVLKDYAGSNKGFSLLLAPFLVHREVKALAKLRGVRGIPQLIRKTSARSFVMEYLDAGSLKEVGADFDWAAFIADSQSLVALINQRGVVHGDLRNASNILVDNNRRPVFVDLVSAVHRGMKWNPFALLLFRQCLVLDQGGIYKLKKKYTPENVNEKDRQIFERVGPLEAIARKISALVRTSVRKIFQM